MKLTLSLLPTKTEPLLKINNFCEWGDGEC